jgi:WD40 repeat protein
MAQASDTIHLAHLTAVAPHADAVEGDPRMIYTSQADTNYQTLLLGSYTPSDEGAPRLVATLRPVESCLGVWDTGTGAFLRALTYPETEFTSLITYQRRSDGRPRIAGGSNTGDVVIWDGNDFRLLQAMEADGRAQPVLRLYMYEETTSGRTRLVTG